MLGAGKTIKHVIHNGIKIFDTATFFCYRSYPLAEVMVKIPPTIGSFGAHAAILTVCWLAFGGDLFPSAATRETTVTVSLSMDDVPEPTTDSFDPPAVPIQSIELTPPPPVVIDFDVEPRPPMAESHPMPPSPIRTIDLDSEKPLNDPRALPASPALPAVAETPPRGISTPHPEYPTIARRMGYEGRVVIVFDVAVDGSCADVRVRESSGYEILDTTAVDAVKCWRFEPATADGNPVARSREIAFTFQLKGGS